MFLVIIILIISGILGFILINENIIIPGKVKRVKDFMQAGEYEKAFNLSQSLPKKMLSQPEVQYLIYEIHYAQQQYYMALSHLNEILKRQNYTNEITELLVRQKIAALYELMEKPKKALEEYHTIVRLDPENLEANSKIGLKLYQMRNFGAAKDYLKKSFELDNSNPNVNNALADVLYRNKHYEDAVNVINSSLPNQKDNYKAYLLRGKCNLKLKKYEACIKDMNEAAKDPGNAAIVNVIKGLAFYRHKENEKAKEKFAAGLDKFTEDYSEIILDASYAYAELLFAEGRINETVTNLNHIRNSGKVYLDVDTRLMALNNLKKYKKLFPLFKGDLEKAVDNELNSGLATLGYTINKKNIINPKAVFLVLLKNIGTANSFKTILGLDLNLKQTATDLIKKLTVYAEVEGLSSAMFFSFTGLSDDTENYIKALNSIELSLLSLRQLEGIISGEKII